jgi:hypothetical protein
VEWNAYTYTQITVQYRVGIEQESLGGHGPLVMVHGWF